MEFDLFSCTFENLNSLKFNELQKLSSQYRVNKRWAKKTEIIDKLLSLRDQELQKRYGIAEDAEINVSLQGNEQWIDGSKVFSTATPYKETTSSKFDRRLTYNLSQAGEEIVDKRLTFNIVKKDVKSEKITGDIDIEISDNIDRRLTYNADELKEIKKFTESIKENCDPKSNINNKQASISIQQSISNDNAVQTTKEDSSFPEKQLSHCQKSNINDKKKVHSLKKDWKINHILLTSQDTFDQVEKSMGLRSAKAKKLTLPYSKIPAQSGRSGFKQQCDESDVKTSEKLGAARRLGKTDINISKIHPQKMLNSSFSTNKHTCTSKSLTVKRNGLLKSDIHDQSLQADLSTLNNSSRRILHRKKSKTEDNVLVTKLKSSINLQFFSPEESHMKNCKSSSEPNTPLIDTNYKSKIPKARAAGEKNKPLTAKKMPDFSKIHQRQFEQMDSILDYKRKKEERAKRLFGVPQPGIPIKVNKGNLPATVFQFKSSHNEKANKSQKTTAIMRELHETDIKNPKEKSNRQDFMNRAGNASNIVNIMKEHNRKYLNGVRTNKRFELQMKFRKI